MGVTVLNRTARMVAVTVAGFAALQLTGCGGGGDSGPAWVAPATPDAAAASGAPATTAPARLARVTSACKLLPAPAVVKILGGSAGTKLTAKEQPVEKKTSGSVRYQCVYGRNGQEPFALTISSMPDRADTATETIDEIVQASGVKTTLVDGLGAAGVGYVQDGVRVLAAVVPYNKELRLVVFTSPTIVPHQKLVEATQHVVQQI